MTGHICIIFTTTILGIHIFHYYSSNSITYNPTVFTGVKKTFVCGQWRTHVRQSGHVNRRVRMSVYSYRHATSTCAVRCMRFLAYFLRFCCLYVTTLFNIDVKNMFSCRRCQLLCCYSAPLLWPIYLHATRVPGISK